MNAILSLLYVESILLKIILWSAIFFVLLLSVVVFTVLRIDLQYLTRFQEEKADSET